jgi:hypothetical protein
LAPSPTRAKPKLVFGSAALGLLRSSDIDADNSASPKFRLLLQRKLASSALR